VAGGEPLLYKPLLDLLRSARSSGMLNTLTSNGPLLTAARMHELAPWLDLVAISIDGSPRQHDLMRGQAVALSRTVANFKHARASGVPFALIFTLTQFNVDELEFIVRLAASEGARGVQIHPLTLYDLVPGRRIPC
jgi:MoaA/NifB/PqqE/SkfB family radical SAM enzyme